LEGAWSMRLCVAAMIRSGFSIPAISVTKQREGQFQCLCVTNHLLTFGNYLDLFDILH